MQGACVDSLILSDLHLGSEISRASEAVELLENMRFRRLILLGDIFADLNFRRLTKEHWKFLSCIRKLSNPKRKIEIVWVEGNHDHGLAEVMSHLVGIPVYEQYVWEYGGKRHLAIHGHQFDRFVINNYLLSRLGEFAYLHLQKWDARHKKFVRYLDRLNTRWLRLTQKVADGALAHAKTGEAERIFCGHTHVAHTVLRDGVEYYNSGSWVDARCTYITIAEEGVRIHEYERQQPSLYRDPGEERTGTAARPARVTLPPGLSAYAAGQSVRC
jgi:UDP-2,3-diacylglucosamine pyrophosphatase LpxH